jgi:hypothetical protein
MEEEQDMKRKEMNQTGKKRKFEVYDEKAKSFLLPLSSCIFQMRITQLNTDSFVMT